MRRIQFFVAFFLVLALGICAGLMQIPKKCHTSLQQLPRDRLEVTELVPLVGGNGDSRGEGWPKSHKTDPKIAPEAAHKPTESQPQKNTESQ